MNQMQPCGYCDGTGQVETRPYDNEGRYKGDDYPTHQPCEYCDGAGECDEGEKLLPARKHRSQPVS